jgi:hypothetical protein
VIQITIDSLHAIAYHTIDMKNPPANHRKPLRRAAALLMFFAFAATLTIGAFHSHTDCVKPDSCTVCLFQLSAFTPILSSSIESNHIAIPVRLSIIDGIDRIPDPFHTRVFSCHAPPAVI